MLSSLALRSVMLGYHLHRTPMPPLSQALWRWIAAGLAGAAAIPHAAVGAFRR
ncbi:hypothetical protein tb265_47600 [Gemmatimonadetes bacterium T265]|nr:hypothetical protein tb265_47600 [Gemmatimonadetes bacterium T265]